MGMKRSLLALIAFVYSATEVWAQEPARGWTASQLATLRHWVAVAPEVALPLLATKELDQAIAGHDQAAVDQAATGLALRLARMQLFGSATASERAGWRIADSDSTLDLNALLTQALSGGSLDQFFDSLKPLHPDYAVLRAAYAHETNSAKKEILGRNMERWRWMPRSLGEDYVLVNAASFEASLWHDGKRVGTWPVIIGKSSKPTPVFSATITGVTFNPWWDIPASIVRESVGALTRRNPGLSRQRGYVWGGGRYRQRPGPGNSLGLMKLVMPNPYNVYMHDTPSKNLFARPVRAFSHGCIRTGDALGYAATLLNGMKTRAEIDAIVSARQTTTVSLGANLLVYVTYFTASARSDGSLIIQPDIYGRDKHMGDAKSPSRVDAD
jgi:murein L,D-transpeptidase YcbB/YkuD